MLTITNTTFSNTTTVSHVNKRLEIWNDESSSTSVTEKYPKAKVVLCSVIQNPVELFQVFDLVDGKPVFMASPLLNAMTNGEVIILDGINFLPVECILAILAICDESDTVCVHGVLTTVKKGFKIVGTLVL